MHGEGEFGERERRGETDGDPEEGEAQEEKPARFVRPAGVVPLTGGVPPWHLDPEKVERARALRRSPTPAAAAAWQLLRNRRTLGLKFRREQVIEGFIADFYCPALGLVLEVDGPVHDAPLQAEYDLARTALFESLGLRVVRVRNEDVTREHLDAAIRPFVHVPPASTPTPSASPSPFRERGPGGEVGDPVLHARRLVAQRCLYGVDKNPLAVSLARLSLWLVTLAKDEPFTFVDHALRHGDSLVGLDLEQIRGFHWKPGAQLEFARELIDTALQEALDARQRILALASQDDTREKEHLLWDANDALAPVRLIADLIVGAFFAEAKDKARESERKRRLDLVVRWLESRREPPEELLAMQRALRERVPAFHWWVEFPEVFYGERPDPLDGGRVNRIAWMDAFVGNPPFAGRNAMLESQHPRFVEWMIEIHPGTSANVDLCGHFFRRCNELIGSHGSLGLIATQTISEGDTRAGSLKPIVEAGGTIFDASKGYFWKTADVYVSVVHIAKGAIAPVARSLGVRLDGRRVAMINSHLDFKEEREDANSIEANARLSFKGNFVLGDGFVLTPTERDALIASEPPAREIVFPYLGGEEVNTSNTQAHDRYIVNFGAREELECRQRWPHTMARLEQLVLPERAKANRDLYRTKWWQHAEPRPGLYAAISELDRCLVTAQVTKHLCFTFVDRRTTFSQQLIVFPLSRYSCFGTLQSRIHVTWVGLVSASFGASSTLGRVMRYSATECFETFPFPQPDPRAVIPALEEVGERLYTARAKYMLDTQQGLTQTYNQLKDPRVSDPQVVALRRLHEEMDRAVVAAYGWSDLVVPAYGTPVTEAEKKALARFEDEVIDRLFALNAVRAAEERAAREKADGTQGAKAAKGGRKKKGDAGSGQGTLGIG